MSQSRYEYDENSETWPYFVLTVILVPLVPATISLVYSQFSSTLSVSNKSTFKSVSDWFQPYNESYLSRYRSDQKKSSLFNLYNFFIVLGWIIVGLLILLISSIDIKVSDINFDPWKILSIDESATEKLIKTAYRKLSLKYHPDKVDTSSMSQKEIDEVDASYVLINKAYKALTDETVKENFLKYGNPDGPNEIKHGIALPKFLIDGPTSPFLVFVYVLLIAVILPLVVGSWWNGVRSTTKQGLQVNTADYFMKVMINYNPAKLILVKDIFGYLSNADEYKELDSSLKPEKIQSLLISYINRETVKEELLRLKVVAITPKLILGFLDIAAAFRNTDICLELIEAHRSIIQALNIQDNAKANRFSQILQLPGVELEKLDTTQNILTLGKLLKKPTVEPSKFLNLDKEKTKKVLDYAASIPLIEPLECKFKVPGEDFVPPMSTVHVDLKFIVKSPKHKSKPSIADLSEDVVATQFNEPETMEYLRNPLKVLEDQVELQLDNLPPYFPDENYLRENCGWVAFVIVQRDNKLGEAPNFIKRVDLSNLKLSQEAYSKSECKVSTFKLPFQVPTPKEVGSYQFRLVLRNMVYFGSDVDIPIVMNVEDKPMEASSRDLYEIEDPDEDSLAGAMAQIRGQPVKRIDQIFENEYESSEDENSDDDEEKSDWTDMDTDTDVEEGDIKK